MTITAKNLVIQRTRCPYCHDTLTRGERPEVCPDCHALHHAECYAEYGACSSCGPRSTPIGAGFTPARPADRSEPERPCDWIDCELPAGSTGLCNEHFARSLATFGVSVPIAVALVAIAAALT